MAAHRYWRAVGLEAYAEGDIGVSEFHLLAAGSRSDASATLTASIAPDVSGTLANVQDDNLSTAARWSAQAAKALVLQWDFGGSPSDVDDIRLAGDIQSIFPIIVRLDWSDDATAWTTQVTYAGIAWPGVGTKTSSPASVIARNTVLGRVGAYSPICIVSGVPIVYGNLVAVQPVLLSVADGAVKDYTTGVRGLGVGRVQGTVKETGTPNAPVRRKVRLIRESDGLVLRELWSHPVTGAYDFRYVDETQIFTVISYDYLHNYRAVVADNITPEIMV